MGSPRSISSARTEQSTAEIMLLISCTYKNSKNTAFLYINCAPLGGTSFVHDSKNFAFRAIFIERSETLILTRISFRVRVALLEPSRGLHPKRLLPCVRHHLSRPRPHRALAAPGRRRHALPRRLLALPFHGAATPAARPPPHARPRACAASPPALLLRLRSAHPNPGSSDSWPWGASRHQIRPPRTQIQWHGRTARQLGAPAPTMGTAAMGVRHGERATSKQPVHSRARCKGRPSSLAGSDAAMLPFQASDHKVAATAGPSILFPIIYRMEIFCPSYYFLANGCKSHDIQGCLSFFFLKCAGKPFLLGLIFFLACCTDSNTSPCSIHQVHI